MTVRLIAAAAAAAALFLAACSSTPPSTQPSSSDDAGVTQPGADSGTSTDQDSGVIDPGSDAGTTPGTDAGTTPTVRFVAVGDTGKGNTAEQQVADAIAATCAQRGCDFVLLLGDNIYPTGVSSATDPQFQTKFEQPYANVNLPVWVVLGNHDYGGNGSGTEFSKGQYEIDYSQSSTKWTIPAAYYRHTHEHVEFFALDTNMQMYSLAGQQKTDVAQWLKDSTATWKIVVGHHPYLSNGPHGNAGNYDGLKYVPIANGAGVKSFADSVWCGKADFYLSGHDHTRQWLQDTCSGTQLIVSGTGAEGTSLDGSNPTYFQSIDLGFVWFEIKGNQLTADFIDATGTSQFTRTVTK